MEGDLTEHVLPTEHNPVFQVSFVWRGNLITFAGYYTRDQEVEGTFLMKYDTRRHATTRDFYVPYDAELVARSGAGSRKREQPDGSPVLGADPATVFAAYFTYW